MRKVQSRSLLACGLAALLALAAGCEVPKPPGAGTVRYRDEITTNLTVTKDLTYSTSQDGVPNVLKLDVYAPASDTVTKRPVLIFVHGGGFVSGSKTGGGVAPDFARRGYVGVSIDYRLKPPPGCGGQATPACETAALNAQHDAQAAVRWLRANASTYGIDPNRIAISGGSAGAVTSLLVATNSQDTGNSGNPGPSSRVQGALSYSGGLPTNDTIDAGDPPTMFFHGTLDTVVPYAWAVSNVAAMLQRGVAGNLTSFDGYGHGVLNETALRPGIVDQSAYWLWYALDLAHAAT